MKIRDVYFRKISRMRSKQTSVRVIIKGRYTHFVKLIFGQKQYFPHIF